MPRVTFRTFNSANGHGVVAGGVARAVRDVKNAVSDREAAGVAVGNSYKKEIDLSGPTGTRGRMLCW